jgi:energy-coupling factor transporter ATP-binding protein EcfA2
MIRIDALSFAYSGTKEPALAEISLEIPAGQFTALIGANGSGKSSLCYAVSGFIPHFYPGTYRGQVQVDGKVIAESPFSQLSQTIGLVLQNPLNQISGAKVTVAEEIAFGLENLGLERPEMLRRVEQVMQQVGISRLANRSPLGLSGGEQQKVVLAAILAMQPRLLVLDEPTAQLDPASAEDIFVLLKQLCQQGVTVLLAEHKIDEVAEHADRIIALSKGAVLLDGSPAEVLTSALLAEHGIASPHLTRLARRARSENLWPPERPLPTRLEQAAAGFRGDEIGS